MRDRIGIVADISRRVADQVMRIVSMEAASKQDMAAFYMALVPVTR